MPHAPNFLYHFQVRRAIWLDPLKNRASDKLNGIAMLSRAVRPITFFASLADIQHRQP
jgi:hypothetical protein